MSSARILIVEDDYLTAINLWALLKGLGHELVGIASDRQTALEFAAERPDLALVDVGLLSDGDTGLSVAERLYREFAVPVILMTGAPETADIVMPGLFGVLEKPYNDQVVAEAVDHALKARLDAPGASPPGVKRFGGDTVLMLRP